jgi:hypothetical protein
LGKKYSLLDSPRLARGISAAAKALIISAASGTLDNMLLRLRQSKVLAAPLSVRATLQRDLMCTRDTLSRNALPR